MRINALFYLSYISQIGSQRCILHYLKLAGTTELPIRLLATTPPIGRLAHPPVTSLPTQQRPSDDAANFVRTWNPPLRHEQLIADQEQLITTQIEALRRTTAIRRELRKVENNGTIALSSGSPRRPSTVSNSKEPRPQLPQPAPASRALDSVSVHSNIRQTRTRQHSRTKSRLTLSSPLSKGMFRRHPHMLSTCRHKVTCSTRIHVLTKTTNCGHYAVVQAASSTKAATVKQQTAHATSSTASPGLTGNHIHLNGRRAHAVHCTRREAQTSKLAFLFMEKKFASTFYTLHTSLTTL